MTDKEQIDILFARIEGWIVNAYFEDEREKLIDAIYRIEALVAELKTVLDAKIEALTAENEKFREGLEQASHNLKVGAEFYECLGLALSAIAARAALEKQP
jgi:hypothetical protein